MNTEWEMFSVQEHLQQILESYSVQERVNLKCFDYRMYMYSLLKRWRREAGDLY